MNDTPSPHGSHPDNGPPSADRPPDDWPVDVGPDAAWRHGGAVPPGHGAPQLTEAEIARMLHSDTVEVDPTAREEAIAAALSAWDETRSDERPEHTATTATRTHRPGPRPSRAGRPRRNRVSSGVLVAAVLVLVVAVAGIVTSRGTSDGEMASTAGDSASETADESTAAQGSGSAHDAGSPSEGSPTDSPSPGRPLALGEAATAEELLDRMASALTETPRLSTDAPLADDRTGGDARETVAGSTCPAALEGVIVAAGSVSGDPVVVVVEPEGSREARHQLVIRAQDCELLATRRV